MEEDTAPPPPGASPPSGAVGFRVEGFLGVANWPRVPSSHLRCSFLSGEHGSVLRESVIVCNNQSIDKSINQPSASLYFDVPNAAEGSKWALSIRNTICAQSKMWSGAYDGIAVEKMHSSFAHKRHYLRLESRDLV